MKTLITAYCRRFTLPVFLLLIAQLANENPAAAQLPVCDGITMYAMFNDSISAVPATASKIMPVNSITGAVGAPLTGAGGFLIFKRYQTTPNRYYYGSASVGVDPVAKRFYANTQMINPVAKDFFAISTATAGSPSGNVIATTPSTSTANVPTGRTTGLDDYHFVKMAVNQAGTFIYAVGVIRDTTLATIATANPVIRMPACPGTGCANAGMMLLGYLPSTPVMMSSWHVYNGDIAFDNVGNLYYATVAYEFVGGTGRYTDARLFKINAADLPTTVGTGVIPMNYIADYNILDSTAMDGIAFDGTGSMYMTTKRFNGVQGLSTTTHSSQLYKTTIAGAASLLPAFTAPAGFSIADLGSCSFPLTLLPENNLNLYGKYYGGNTRLSWNVNDIANVGYYEVQRSDDGTNFSTIARVETQSNNGQASLTYTYDDAQSGYGQTKYYRVREVMNTGIRVYSRVITILLNTSIRLLHKSGPNPFVDNIDVDVQLKSAGTIVARLTDQSGRVVYRRNFNGPEGENKFKIDGVLHLAPGIYILELQVGEETIRQKLIKG